VTSPPTSSTDRVLLAASAAIAAAAVVTRLHNITSWPAMYDWDAPGYAVNVIDFMEGHWPDPRSWGGSHPPLYSLVSALLWAVLPDAVPVHVTMRAVSTVAWVATVGLVWRSLRTLVNPVDAAVVAVLLLAIPGLTIASSMMTNDALCALFVTMTLVRLLETPRSRRPTIREIAVTGALAGLAAATKATGAAAVGIAAAFYAWRERVDPKRAAQAVVVIGVVAVALAGPHYARLFWVVSGSPYDVLAARAGSAEKEAIATFVHAVARENMRSWSYWQLVHTALWGDPTKTYLQGAVETHPFTRAVWVAGLLVVPVALAGMVRLLVRRDLRSTSAVALVFGAAFVAMLVPHAVDRPYIVLTKTTYVLPVALPLGIVLAFGLDALRGAAGAVLRAALLAVAAAGVALTVFGWWEPAPPPSDGGGSRAAAASSAARVVERYFTDRAHDPIRALRLLAPEVQLTHGLRLLHVLGLPPLESDASSAADERSRELARARVAWLEIPHLARWMQPILSGLDVAVVDVAEHDDATDVRVRIAAGRPTPPPGGELGQWPFPPLGERLTLERAGDGWRITRLEETDVVDENAVETFAVHPTGTGFDHLRALGWRPPLDGVAAALGLAPARPE